MCQDLFVQRHGRGGRCDDVRESAGASRRLQLSLENLLCASFTPPLRRGWRANGCLHCASTEGTALVHSIPLYFFRYHAGPDSTRLCMLGVDLLRVQFEMKESAHPMLCRTREKEKRWNFTFEECDTLWLPDGRLQDVTAQITHKSPPAGKGVRVHLSHQTGGRRHVRRAGGRPH